jgi:hypothetical protein
MVWGGSSASVPALGFWSLCILAAVLVTIGGRSALRQGRSRNAVTLGALLVAMAVPMTARAVTLPFTFVNGAVADANHVNANFEALSNAIDAGPQVYLDSNFQNLALTAFPGVTVASLALPSGTYLAQAKLRYRNTGGGPDNPSCVWQKIDGSSLSVDSSIANVPAGAEEDGFMLTRAVIHVVGAQGLRVQCFGLASTFVINSQLTAMGATFIAQ